MPTVNCHQHHHGMSCHVHAPLGLACAPPCHLHLLPLLLLLLLLLLDPRCAFAAAFPMPVGSMLRCAVATMTQWLFATLAHRNNHQLVVVRTQATLAVVTARPAAPLLCSLHAQSWRLHSVMRCVLCMRRHSVMRCALCSLLFSLLGSSDWAVG
jgi:hypothetical protein